VRTSVTKLIFLKYIPDWGAERLRDDKRSPVVFHSGLPRVD
jgi:hypothetical protein